MYPIFIIDSSVDRQVGIFLFLAKEVQSSSDRGHASVSAHEGVQPDLEVDRVPASWGASTVIPTVAVHVHSPTGEG